MAEFDDGVPKYPMLKLVVRHGRIASIGLAAVVLGLMAGIGIVIGSPWPGVIGVVLAALAFVLARVLVELVSLITDMLLPQ